MPNHIKNRLTLTGEALQIDEFITQFSTVNKAELSRTFGEPKLIICKSTDGNVGWFNERTGEFTQRGVEDAVIGLPDGFEFSIDHQWTRFPDFNKIVPMPAEIEASFDEPGIRPPWYTWSIENWDTKWNSYSCKKKAYNVFEFDTAWSNVSKLVEIMSKEFPNIEIEYKYADEDTGCNCGIAIYKGGEISFQKMVNSSKEAYELAFDLRPDYQKEYVLVDDNYVYKEEEETA